jgi:YfiH family protein
MWVRTEHSGQMLWQVADWLALPWLKHGFSTSAAGNLLETEKREAFGSAVGMPPPWTTVRQVHGSEVVWVNERWLTKAVHTTADGMVTRTSGVVLAEFFADCVPLLFVDPKTRTVAVSHAGWRGTKAEIGLKTVAAMVRAGCRVEDIQAAVGPSIGPCCYEVSHELTAYFPGSVFSKVGGRLHLDLWSANAKQLREAGIRQVSTAERCTMCSGEFFSYRRDQTAFRMAALITVD